jgi:hypothetical protein
MARTWHGLARGLSWTFGRSCRDWLAFTFEAMTELQKPILRSDDFPAGVASFRSNPPGVARFAGR